MHDHLLAVFHRIAFGNRHTRTELESHPSVEKKPRRIAHVPNKKAKSPGPLGVISRDHIANHRTAIARPPTAYGAQAATHRRPYIHDTCSHASGVLKPNKHNMNTNSLNGIFFKGCIMPNLINYSSVGLVELGTYFLATPQV